MRINRFIASATGISRRQADKLIQGSKVFINDIPARLSDHATTTDKVTVDRKRIYLPTDTLTIMMYKPVGYVCSRVGQGSKTVYDLLPPELHHLKPVGRLDKDSSGLLLMTDDGHLANELTHPKYEKTKVYEIELDRPLDLSDEEKLEAGIQLSDGTSHLIVSHDGTNLRALKVTMQEGRNRQIRRTFSALGYTVKKLHRTQFGDYKLHELKSGAFKKLLNT